MYLSAGVCARQTDRVLPLAQPSRHSSDCCYLLSWPCCHLLPFADTCSQSYRETTKVPGTWLAPLIMNIYCRMMHLIPPQHPLTHPHTQSVHIQSHPHSSSTPPPRKALFTSGEMKTATGAVVAVTYQPVSN